MIFPAGKRRNIDTEFNPLRDNPRSPYYEPELKKNVRKAQREAREEPNGVTDPRSIHYQPEMKSGRSKRHEWAERPVDQHMEDVKQCVFNKSCSITSARAGNLSDIGGPVHQMHTATANSIWDHNVLERIRSEETEGEKLRERNAQAAEERKQLRMSDRNLHIDKDAFLAAYANSLVRSDSVAANHAHATNDSNYSKKVAGHHMSIFDYVNVNKDGTVTPVADKDKVDFARLDEKTPGELIAKHAQDRRGAGRKDRSWETPTRPMHSREKLSALFANMKRDGK